MTWIALIFVIWQYSVLQNISLFSALITFPRKIGLYTRTSNGNENHNTIPSNVHRYSTLKCDAKYESSLEDNLKHIRATNFSAALPYMEKFRLNESPLSTTFNSHVTVPVFVTACSSNHFFETLGLLKNIEGTVRPVYKDLKIIIYNLGLEEEEIKQVDIFFDRTRFSAKFFAKSACHTLNFINCLLDYSVVFFYIDRQIQPYTLRKHLRTHETFTVDQILSDFCVSTISSP